MAKTLTLLAEDDITIVIEPLTKNADIETYRNFREARENATEHEKYLLEVATNHEPALAEQAMKYKYLQEYGNSKTHSRL